MVLREEPDLQLLLERGAICDYPVALIDGEARDCHSNAAQYWHEHRQTCAIVTGYALSDDGLWRQHTWLLETTRERLHSRILETTTIRRQYFGVVLFDDEAENFYRLTI
jgi:hypothetical protein